MMNRTPARARAVIRGAGAWAGVNGLATFRQCRRGVLVTVEVHGLPVGEGGLPGGFLWAAHPPGRDLYRHPGAALCPCRRPFSALGVSPPGPYGGTAPAAGMSGPRLFLVFDRPLPGGADHRPHPHCPRPPGRFFHPAQRRRRSHDRLRADCGRLLTGGVPAASFDPSSVK